ncbi:MAG: cobalt transporter component CbiQ [Pseudomonadota bacterium]
MLPESPTIAPALFQQLDPRVKLVSALFFSVWVVVQHRLFLLGIGLGIAILLTLLARLPPRLLFTRLLSLNLFLGLLGLFLPFTTPSEHYLQFAGLNISLKGLYLWAEFSLKANSVLLGLNAFLATTDIIVLGHALEHLHVPVKLTRLLLLTLRYINVLHASYQQLSRAMQVRGFRLHSDRHSYRSIGNLLGMLLVRSFCRAQQIEAAMRCRGYRGHFYLLHHFTLSFRDKVFIAIFYPNLLLLMGIA